MKIKHRQTSKYGCGSYSLANLFNDKRFIKEIDDKRPERTVDLNAKMAEYMPELYIDPIYVTSPHYPFQNRLTRQMASMFNVPDGTDQKLINTMAKPYIIIYAHANYRMHSVGFIHNLETDTFIMLDSAEEEIIEGDILRFIKNYEIVAVLQFGIWSATNPGNYMMVEKSALPHIFKK